MFQKIGRFIKKIIVYIYVFLRNLYHFKISKLYKKSDEVNKNLHILEAINYIKVAGGEKNLIPKVYFEFGCFSGRTFSAAINSARFLNLKFDFFAFDSFMGLPETDEDNIFKKEQFKFSKNDFKKIIKKNSGVLLDDKNIIEGFYENSLKTQKAQNLPSPGIVYLDCDLYTSTISALNFLKSKLANGSVLLFDDYYCYPVNKNAGQKKAINEFLQHNANFQFVKWKAFSSFGQSFFFINKSDND